MRSLLSTYLGTMVLAVATGSAAAADLPVKAPPYSPAPVWSWAGTYVGANIGYGWGSGDNNTGCIGDTGLINGPFCQIVPGGKLKSSGIVGGGQIGHNWQIGRSVFGVEADFSGSDINGSRTAVGPFPFVSGGVAPNANIYSGTQQLSWWGTVRLRGGYAVADRTLLYLTGGLAYGRSELASNLTGLFGGPPIAGSYPAADTVTKLGWTIGGGIEHAVTDRVIARLEGLYVDLGDKTITGPEVPLRFLPLGFTRLTEFNLQYAIVRAGLSYKFN